MDIQDFIDKRYQWDGEDMSHFPDNLQEFAELCAKWHYMVATSTNATISTCEQLGGKIYQHSQNMLLAAIKAAYPEMDESEIYERWNETGDPLKYCAKRVKEWNESEMYNED